jgi:hypothetical protein
LRASDSDTSDEEAKDAIKSLPNKTCSQTIRVGKLTAALDSQIALRRNPRYPGWENKAHDNTVIQAEFFDELGREASFAQADSRAIAGAFQQALQD